MSRWLLNRRAPWLIALLGFLLALPTLRLGYFLDDFYHMYALDGGELPGGPKGNWDLYRFASGQPTLGEAKASGYFAWWTSDDFRIAFLRPIPSLWRALDHALFGANALIPHLETCVVFGLLVWTVSKLLKRFLGDSPAAVIAAMLGTLAFAIDDSHATSISWIANRYALVAALFGALSFVTLGSQSGRVRALSAPLWILALLSGEASLCFVAFFGAWIWLHKGDERRVMFKRTLPHVLCLAAWVIAYKLGGYGVKGSGFYVDPASTPIAFLAKMFIRAPVLFLAQLTFIPAEASGPLVPHAHYVLAAIGLVVSLLGVRWIDRTCERSRPVRALLLAGFVGLLPMTATAPDDRLLLIPGIAIFGALGAALAKKLEHRRLGGKFGGAASFFTAAHFVIAPLLFVPRQSVYYDLLGPFIRKHAQELPADEAIREQRLFILAAPDALLTSFMYIERIVGSAPNPRASFLLTVGSPGDLIVTRPAANELVFSAEGGLVGGPFAHLYRATPFVDGERVDVDVFEAHVVRTTDGHLMEVAFTFKQPLESARWVIFGEQGFTEVTLPAVGESARFDGWDLGRAMN